MSHSRLLHQVENQYEQGINRHKEPYAGEDNGLKEWRGNEKSLLIERSVESKGG